MLVPLSDRSILLSLKSAFSQNPRDLEHKSLERKQLLFFSTELEQVVSYQLLNKEMVLKVHITFLNPGNTLDQFSLSPQFLLLLIQYYLENS